MHLAGMVVQLIIAIPKDCTLYTECASSASGRSVHNLCAYRAVFVVAEMARSSRYTAASCEIHSGIGARQHAVVIEVQHCRT